MPGGAALVTGAAGFFGSAIVRALALTGHDVVATDRVEREALVLREDVPAGRVNYARRDVASEPLDDLVAEVEAVVHAAALTPAAEAGDTSDDLLRVNLSPLPGLLRAVRTSPRCRRFIFVSSAGAYDQRPERVLREDDADGGTSLYGATKLAAEQVVRRYGALNAIETAAVRPTSLYGAGELPRPSRPRPSALARLVEHARRDERVAVARTEARADWLAVDDAADAVVLLCAAPALDGRAYNLSSGTTRPFSDVVEAVVAVTGLVVDAESPEVVEPGPDRAAIISNTRAVETLGWRPVRTLEDGVRDLVEFLDSLTVKAAG